MAEGFTNTRATSILSSNIKRDTYVALSSTIPTKDGENFIEPASSTGYTRRAIGDLDVSIPAQIANRDAIFLFEALADCGSFSHLGLSDSKERGSSVFLVAQLTAPVTVPAGYVPLIRAHKLVIGLDKASLESYV